MNRTTSVSISALALALFLMVNVPLSGSIPVDVAVGSSSLTNHHTIRIIGNAGFNATNNVSSGSGTQNDPFVIRDLDINASNDHGILIINTTAHFRIINVTVHSGDLSNNSGIRLINIENGSVENSKIIRNADGIYLEYSRNVLISSVNIEYCSHYGINSNNCSVVTVDGSESRFSSGVGIFFDNVSGVKISDCSINNNSASGLYYWNVYDFEINNSLVLANGARGIEILNEWSNFRVLENTIYWNYGQGILVEGTGTGTCEIFSNQIRRNRNDGILLKTTSHLSVVYNKIMDNGKNGIKVYTWNCVIERNDIYQNWIDGIHARDNPTDNIIRNNSIFNNNNHGVILYGYGSMGGRNVIEGNDVYGHNSIGIYLSQSSDNQIINNTIHHNYNGGFLLWDSGYRNIIKGNHFHNGTGTDISITSMSWGNVIDSNRIEKARHGGINAYSPVLIINNTITGDRGRSIHIWEVQNMEITSNILSGDSVQISLDACRNIQIYRNIIESGSITLDSDYDDLKGVVFYDNIMNTTGINYLGDNRKDIRWNVDKTSGKNIVGGDHIAGNFWGNYTGDDLDGDGIGDSNIPWGPGDNSPLVMLIKPPDSEPPYFVDMTRKDPETGERFDLSILIKDNRSLWNVTNEVHISCYQSGLNSGSGGWLEIPFGEVTFDLSGYLNFSVVVPMDAISLNVEVTTTDFMRNRATFDKIFSVNDIVKPNVFNVDKGSTCTTGSSYCITALLKDNTGIERSYVEYCINSLFGDTCTKMPEDPETDPFNPLYMIEIPNSSRTLDFRVIAEDKDENIGTSKWYSVDVQDTIPPTMIDMTIEEPCIGKVLPLIFKLDENIELKELRLITEFDGFLQDDLVALSPIGEYWNKTIEVPDGCRIFNYSMRLYDTSDNWNVFYREIKVHDPILPTVEPLLSVLPETGLNFRMEFECCDNIGVGNGFLEWWFDNDDPVNSTGVFEEFEISKVPIGASILNVRIGVADLDSNWVIEQYSWDVLDGIPPTLVLEYGVSRTSEVFIVDCLATDNRDTPVMKLQYRINSEPEILLAQCVDGSFRIDVQPDIRTIFLIGQVTDGSGNEFVVERTVDVEDGTPPEIISIEWMKEKDGIMVHVNVSDNREIIGVILHIIEDGISMDTILLQSSEENPEFWSTLIEDDGFEFMIEVKDAEGNSVLSISQEIEGSKEDGHDPYLEIILLIFSVLSMIGLAIFASFIYFRGRIRDVVVVGNGKT